MIPDFRCCLRQTKLALRYRLLVPKLVPLLVEKPIVLVLSPCPYLLTFEEAVTCSRVEYDGSSCALAVAEAPLFKNYQLSFWETPNFNENRSRTLDSRNSCNLTLTATSPLTPTHLTLL